MKFLFAVLMFSAVSPSFAQAFIAKDERAIVLNLLNNSSWAHQGVEFEEIRCSQRGRTCVVKAQAAGAPVTCLIDRISSSEDLIVGDLSSHDLKVSGYMQKSLDACLVEALSHRTPTF